MKDDNKDYNWRNRFVLESKRKILYKKVTLHWFLKEKGGEICMV